MNQEIPNPTIPAMEGNGAHSAGPAPETARRPDAAPSHEGRALLEALLRQWRPIMLSGVVVAVVAGYVGWRHWKPVHTAIAQVVRYESPNNEEVFRPRQTAPQTFAVALRSPQLLRLVGERAEPKLTADQLAEHSRVTPEFNSDILTVAVTDADPDRAVALANLYAQEGVRFTQSIQADAAGEVVTYLQSQLTSIEDQLTALQPQSVVLASGTAVPAVSAPAMSATPSALVLRWQAARDELVNLLGTYTEAHPTVIAQRSRIAALEQEMKNQGVLPAMTGPAGNALSPTGPMTPAAPVATGPQPDREVVRSQLQSLENARAGLASRLNAAQLFRRDPPGYLRLFAEATPAEVATESPRGKVIAVAGLGGLLGLGLATGIVLLCEFGGSRLRTAADVERVTRLPVLASLGDLGKMTPAEESLWGFRTWTALQNRLTRSPNQGFVCAITSAGEGEGRSTWINLLARSAGQLGFRVLTVGTRPSDTPPAKSGAKAPATDVAAAEAAGEAPSQSLTTTPNVLASPAEVSAQLAHANDQALVHIPLPGWVWNLDRRKEWQSALGEWSLIDNVVILVELPPSDLAESVLLAQNLPNLLWLVDSGRADATETRRQLQTLRDARCRLVGAVLNHEPSAPLQKLFPRWHQAAAGWSTAGA